MAGKMGKMNDISNEMADLMGMPRSGESTVDMHNRQTGDFIKNNTQTPKVEPPKVEANKPANRPAKTQVEARKKYGIAMGADYE
jgi:hypothetical protein